MKKLHSLLFASAVAVTMASCSQKSEMDSYIDNLMSRMTVEQKIGQLNLHSAAGFVSALTVTEEDQNVKLLRAGQLGGMYGTSDVNYMRQIQEIALQSGAGIPLIFGLDVIHGHETVMPVPIALSTSWNMDLIEKTARTAAVEASALGVNWVFSPMVDIARDARWGRIAEGGGEDPYLGGEIARAMVLGYQGHDDEFAEDEVLTCVKHYAMYGGAEAGRDYNTVQLSRQEALNGFMRPYMVAAQAGAASYMSSFNEFEGIPATMNEYLLDELLRKTWGFDGFVVTDATAIKEEIAHGIGDLQEVSARSLKAGIDMDMNSDGFVGTLQKSLDEGRVKMADIDKACRRILEAKYKLGLFADPFKYLDPDRAAAQVFTPEHRAVALEAARESMVLLKNNGVLPLSKNARIAVVGPLADDKDAMCGTWSMSKHTDQTVTPLQGIREAAGSVAYAQGSNIFLDKEMEETVRFGLMKMFMPNFKAPGVHQRSNADLVAEAVSLARRSDVVVAVVGETQNMNGEGASRSDITIPAAQKELLRALKATGKPVVMVLLNGRPLALPWENENMDAILDIFAAGTEGGHALADVLFGDVNPSGKLTLSFPYSVGQEPLYYNHKNTGRPHPDYAPYRKFTSNYMDVVNGALYPFGFGLSYTTYKYGEVQLSSDSMTADGRITASVDVTNAGGMDGLETVQLYIHDVYSTSTRPVKELRAFRKVSIPAGQTVKVSFELGVDDLKYYNHDLEYVAEAGEYEIMIGPDSQNLSSKTFVLK